MKSLALPRRTPLIRCHYRSRASVDSRASVGRRDYPISFARFLNGMPYHCVAPVSAVVGDEFMLLDDDMKVTNAKEKKRASQTGQVLHARWHFLSLILPTIPYHMAIEDDRHLQFLPSLRQHLLKLP